MLCCSKLCLLRRVEIWLHGLGIHNNDLGFLWEDWRTHISDEVFKLYLLNLRVSLCVWFSDKYVYLQLHRYIRYASIYAKKKTSVFQSHKITLPQFWCFCGVCCFRTILRLWCRILKRFLAECKKRTCGSKSMEQITNINPILSYGQ